MKRGSKTMLGLIILSLALGRISVGNESVLRDPCEVEALRAYARALKICELAQNPNPRLRCYEAALSVYLNTLQECRGQGR